MIDYASVIDGALAWLWDNKLVLAGWIIALIWSFTAVARPVRV